MRAEVEDFNQAMNRHIALVVGLRALAEDLTLLTVLARFPWALQYALRQGYTGPWRIVEDIIRSQR